MLMKIIVAYVDNSGRGEELLTFVNKKMTEKAGKIPVQEQVGRDFDIRGELCNFAQILN